MRILYITSRADHGGGPEHLYRLLEGLSPGIEAWVACPDEFPYAARYRELPRVKGVLPIAHRAFRMGDLLAVRSLARKEGVDCIHSHGKGAGLLGRPAALLSGVPCVHTFHGVHMGGYGWLAVRLYMVYERIMGLLTRRGIAVSRGEREQLLELGFIPADRLEQINNGVLIPPEPVSAPSAEERLTVVTVSRFDYQKNTEAVLAVMERLEVRGELDRFRFVFIGDGEGRPKLERTATMRWREACLFTGVVDSIGEYVAGAFCCLSTSRWEGLPLALLEAMSFGVPVVASDVVGNRDVIADPELLYPLGDVDRVADILCGLAEDPELWLRRSRRGRDRVAGEFSLQDMVAETEAVYDDLCGRSG